MINLFIGNIGHLFVILAFVLSLASAFSYFKGAQHTNPRKQSGWVMNGRILFYLHSALVVGVIAVLFLIIYQHKFEYHYAYAHASRHLPVHYMISCFWEGQEGSFLLWIFWNCVLGLVLIKANKRWEAPLMVVFALVQAFLTSMILGFSIFDMKIGSSPFVLLKDVIQDPIFQINPDFVPKDGTGLNPLLQNYWMVIHPPTLFLGYATTLIPFSYVIAALWKKDYSNWIKPALPWAIFSTALMALGQLMGAYWAYETLSFGGYWSWDPVENAVYVPWIIQVASIHTMIIFNRNSTALKTSIILVISTFILILYATFLTRSGILGNASVHSFTDLGLSGQLLIYLLFFAIAAVILSIDRWKSIPGSEREVSTYSREFWIFMGAIVLGLMGFQVIMGTSIPVYNVLLEKIGINSNMAPPVDQAIFYSKFQIWGAILIAILSGTGQFFFWKNMDKSRLWSELSIPIIISLVLSTLIFSFYGIKKVPYILLLTAGVYSVVANGTILLKLFKSKKPRLAGGAIAHIGVALMLLGILFSAGYSKVISLNTSGLLYSKNMSDEMNLENVLLYANDPRQMSEYELTYKGKRVELKGIPGYPAKSLLQKTSDEYTVVAKGPYYHKGQLQFEKGDTLSILPENTYFEIEYKKNNKPVFTLFPRAQVNPNMGLIVSPDIRRKLDKDLYTHIASIPDPEAEKEWSDPQKQIISIGERFFINDYVATLTKIRKVDDSPGIELGPEDVAAEAIIEVLTGEHTYLLRPVFIVKDKLAGHIAYVNEEIGAEVSLININPDEGTFEFSIRTTQKDYIIMKAIEMPFINVLWMGTVVLMLGFSVAVFRRYKDFSKSLRG
jgi:cytochrome c-type biogenesis protein CcmF